MLGKEKFPYTEAAIRSVQLWHFLTPARVVLTIVYTGDTVSGDLEDRDQYFANDMNCQLSVVSH